MNDIHARKIGSVPVVPVALIVLKLLTSAKTLGAMEYQLRVASVEEKLFLRYVQTQGRPFQAEQHILPQLEAALERGTLSVQVLLPDREPQLQRPLSAALMQGGPTVVRTTSAQAGAPWITVVWEGTPGQTAIFRISSPLVHYQGLTQVAVNTDGVLRRLPVQGVPLFGRRKLLAPALSDNYIAYARERGTFEAWVAQHAVSHNGLSVVVGLSPDQQFPDAVYLLVQMPPEAKTYKVVMAWRDRDVKLGDSDNQTRID